MLCTMLLNATGSALVKGTVRQVHLRFRRYTSKTADNGLDFLFMLERDISSHSEAIKQLISIRAATEISNQAPQPGPGISVRSLLSRNS
jgi:hypothetical protein